MERRAPRYAHAEGHTEVIYSSDGKDILTCGSDGDIRVWNDLEDDDPRSVCVGEWALSMLMLGDRLYVSTDNHAVQTYTYPAFEKDGIVTRFTAPVTHIASYNNSSDLVCASENMEVRICTNNENKWSSNKLDHQGPVLGISVCPLSKYCMTSCGDGIYRIWDLSNLSIVKEINSVPKVNSFYAAKVLGRSSFQPKTGKLLAYPNNKEIVLLETSNWQQKFTLNHPQIKSPISLCVFSPCGNYLAASTTIGQIVVWDVNQQRPLDISEDVSSLNISSMAWNPLENGELACCDVTGQLLTVVNCYQNSSHVPTRAPVITENLDIDDEMNADDDENLDLIEIIEREGENDEAISEMNDDEEDDENTISLRKLKKETLKSDLNLDGKDSTRRSRSRSRSPSPSKLPTFASMQLPFQPSSTPVNLEHRYMCWNEIGIVRCHSTENNNNIEVEFHDTNIHHGIHLNNHLNHTLASLSSSVLVLACEVPSKIVCIAFKGGSKEWSVILSDLEEVLCVVATENIVAIATSNRLLRLYTIFGTQLHVLSLLGSPVCLTGRAGFLNVFYHSADPGQEDQHIAMDILQIRGATVNCRRTGIPVALSSGARLNWAGCSELGSPITLDSSGMLRMYNTATSVWIPVCDTVQHYKGVSDRFFIISINESDGQAAAILCRGTLFPPTAPRPVVMQLPLKLPFCEMDTEKSQYEEEFRRTFISQSSNSSINYTEIVLKLFALACRSEDERRAIEIIELLHDHNLCILAARYASRLGKLHLADKLSDLSNRWKENNITENPMDNFETTQDNLMTENESEDLNESIIIPAKKNNSDSLLKPIPILKSSQGKRNPFRLSVSNENNKSKNGQNPLTLTNRKFIHDEDENSILKPTISNPLPKEGFLQWFERNKEALMSENPSTIPEELNKIGVKMFKSLLFADNNETLQKRKHSPEPEDSFEVTDSPILAPKQSKLSAFTFKKKN